MSARAGVTVLCIVSSLSDLYDPVSDIIVAYNVFMSIKSNRCKLIDKNKQNSSLTLYHLPYLI